MALCQTVCIPRNAQTSDSFGNYAWERADAGLTIQKTGLSGQWKIGAEDAALTHPIVFSVFPWKTKMIERKLKELGYDVRRHKLLSRNCLRRLSYKVGMDLYFKNLRGRMAVSRRRSALRGSRLPQSILARAEEVIE